MIGGYEYFLKLAWMQAVNLLKNSSLVIPLNFPK